MVIAPASASRRRSRRPGTNLYSSMTIPTDRATATVRGMMVPSCVSWRPVAESTRRRVCCASLSSSVRPAMPSTSTAVPTTSARSTSFPRAIGRECST